MIRHNLDQAHLRPRLALSQRRAGTITYWFCSGAAVFLILWGLMDTLFGKRGPGGILLFCLMVAAIFYLAGSWVRRKSLKA